MSIVLDQVTKRYGRQTIVDHVSLEVADGELFVLLGASGSGKSTILRMIAGLITPDEGTVMLRGRDVTLLPPQERGVGFVFQNYSIFRHLSVAENIEFGLKVRGVAAAERKLKCEKLLDLVGLTGLGTRFASQLSGGQQQRVALARALAYEPAVLLLDEPFGALDVKIRAQLRRSLREIQHSLDVTTILVTHDQEEAFELADRIAVLERGQLLEVGEGEALYNQPKTLFVATFLGAGTVISGRSDGEQAHFGPLSFPIPDNIPHDEGAQVQLLFRPEQVLLNEEKPASNHLLGHGEVIERTFSGSSQRLRLRLPRLHATRQITPALPFGEEGLLVDAVLSADRAVENREFWVSLRGWHMLKPPLPRLMIFDNGSGGIAPLALANMLASRLNASVTVLTVADKPDTADAAIGALDERKQEVGLSQAETRIRYGDVAEQIINEQAERLYDMLILAPKPKRPISTDQATDGPNTMLSKVLKNASVPVMIVKGERNSFSRILICTAAGEPGKGDVQLGGRIARRLGAVVTLLYVTIGWDEPGPIPRAHLERAAATLRAMEVESRVKIRQDVSPAAGILNEAREGDFDLIVAGGHGPRSRSLFSYDDVTVQVISGADRPVLVVPAELV
jgi:sulfate transport system ATP-binding protein